MSGTETGWNQGVWRAERHAQHDHSRWGELWLIHAGDADDDGDPFIAQVHCFEAKANAHLIAAAPDLYEAAEESREGIAVLDNLIRGIEKHGHYSVESTLTFLKQARQHAGLLDAAMRKARGES